MQTATDETLSRLWGTLFENTAIAYEVARTGNAAIQLPGFARADALIVPDIQGGVRPISLNARPYWFEAKAKRRPLLDAKEPKIYLPQKVWVDLVHLFRITRMRVRWLVAAPDVVLSLWIPDTAPAGVPIDPPGNDVYFTLDQFDRDPDGSRHFKEVF